MNFRSLVFSGFVIIGIFIFPLINSCSSGVQEDKIADNNTDALNIWSDTVVKAKYQDGTIAEVWGYRAGDTLLHFERKFYRNGGIWIEGTSYGNIRHGKWRAYDEDGNLISMGSYKMGKGEGVKTVWHSNGQKFYEGHVKDGERVGVWEFFDDDGKKIKEIDYSQLRLERQNN